MDLTSLVRTDLDWTHQRALHTKGRLDRMSANVKANRPRALSSGRVDFFRRVGAVSFDRIRD